MHFTFHRTINISGINNSHVTASITISKKKRLMLYKVDIISGYIIGIVLIAMSCFASNVPMSILLIILGTIFILKSIIKSIIIKRKHDE